MNTNEVEAPPRYNFIPISHKLISHIRRLDGFNEDQLIDLKEMMIELAKLQDPQFAYTPYDLSNPHMHNFLQITLKLHQTLALLDVEYDKVFPANPEEREVNVNVHISEVQLALLKSNGLQYTPRDRTTSGRVFEHIADAKILVDKLSQVKCNSATKHLETPYFVKIVEQTDESKSVEFATKVVDKVAIGLGVTFQTWFLTVNKAYIDLTMKANGKADLYFHAYFVEQYIKSLELQSGTSQQSILPELQKHNFMKRISGLSHILSKVIVNIKKFPFHEKMYFKYVNEFGKKQTSKKMKYLEEIQRALFVAQISDDQEGMFWIEKLLIQLLGYCDIQIRDQAIVLLNMLYDGVDWQLQEAFRPVVRSVGQHFFINMHVHKNALAQDSLMFLGLSAPSPIEGNNHQVLTWHKVEERNIEEIDNYEIKINVNFGKYWKCGFYDWRLVVITNEGKLQPVEIVGKPQPVFPSRYHDDEDEDEEETNSIIGSIAQGRFIVHSKGIRDHSLHEVQVDYQDAQVDKQHNNFVRRGTFNDVERSIPRYSQEGVSCIYLMGTLERDNYPHVNQQYNNEVMYRKEDASSLAIVDRCRPNSMLGGEDGLKKVIKTAKDYKVRIITDALARISSSRYGRKYKHLLLQFLDQDGRVHMCYGTDGQAQKFEDTAMLNYRKIEAWNMLIDEVLEYTQKYGIDGIHLDNGQAWPQILEPDLDELMRIDVDGGNVYTPEDFMNGEVVFRNENYGYWNSNNMETYPNPFFIKMCKKLWFHNPDFIIIGECWGGYMLENRQIILSRSGVIPRMYKLPMAISSLFGKKLHKDGRIEKMQNEDSQVIEKWYDDSRKFLPEGSILIQSSTAHQLPYPAYLYGKGTWAAIDILFFMPDIPITFMNETQGEIFKVGHQQAIFQQEQSEVQETDGPQLKRTNSQLMKLLQEQNEDNMSVSTVNSGNTEQKRGLVKVRSGINLAQTHIDAKEGKIDVKEKEFKQKELDIMKGYDLSQVVTHYAHRRKLRREKMVLRYGELIHLQARSSINEVVPNILCYARYSLSETVVIATNLIDRTQKFVMDLSALLPIFHKLYGNNTVVMVRNVMGTQTEPEYYFLREFIELKNLETLPSFRSIMMSLTVCQDDQFIFKKCLTTSIERTTKNLLSGKSIENEQISLLFTDCIENNPTDIQRFANVIGSIQNSFLDKLQVSFRDLFTTNSRLNGNLEMSSRLMAMTKYILQQSAGAQIAPTRAAASMFESNKLGPIVFCTPEIGRWSTVGGLGVMVDELAIGLAELGQDIIVISPYYNFNRKGEKDYLMKDPAGIRYVDNIRVDIGNGFTLGVHEGMVSGVKQVFLHNGDVFPSPYPDAQPSYIVQQIAVFGKACLEYLCQRGVIPSICITNDWFTGLIAAYAKIGHFGDTFKGTTFLHICHNLKDTYEGRVYLGPNENLDGIHKLHRDWLTDPSWGRNIINPSRCALLLSDQWATVSKSYREELLNSSSLCGILRQKPNPFAFPNGIPIKERLKKLDQSAPDHLTAKKYLQQKYFQFGDLDDEICMFAFVGRVVEQKGVHLILEVAEELIRKYPGKVQFLVAGPANMKVPYDASCAHRMWNLKHRFPNSFWAAPEEFFSDGSLVNRGADFGLMPSAFEPGGIVQHEFFVGETPVIAFKTGGLKDSVIEYNWDSETGTGFTFESYNRNDFMFAIERAIGTFKNKHKYNKLRKMAFKGCMDGAVVSRAWLAEFYRLKNKIFIDVQLATDIEKKFTPWKPQDYQPISIIQEIFGQEKKQQLFQQEFDLGATDNEEEPGRREMDTIMSHFDSLAYNKRPYQFKLPNRGPRHRKVELCGSFDDWKVRHDMSFDPFTNMWFINLHMKPGEEFLYKYVINDNQWVMNDDEPKRKDVHGNMNNFVSTEF